MKTKRKSSKNDQLLLSVAESVGSALGTLVAKANAAKKSLSTAERRSRKLVRKSVRKGESLIRTAKKATGRSASKTTRRVKKTVRRARRRVAAVRTKTRRPR